MKKIFLALTIMFIFSTNMFAKIILPSVFARQHGAATKLRCRPSGVGPIRERPLKL